MRIRWFFVMFLILVCCCESDAQENFTDRAMPISSFVSKNVKINTFVLVGFLCDCSTRAV